ncbi:MAG: response regulator, partial [Gammaproteobacteria bacterium]
MLRILLVEDVATDAQLALRELRRAGIALEYRIVDSEEAFVRELAAFAPHVILSDFSIPQFDGMAALALAREHAPDTPFLFISGTIGEEYAIRALR